MQQQQEEQDLRDQQQQTEEEEGEGEGGSEGEGEREEVSPTRRSLGPARRVPAGAPDAAPRYDEGAGDGDDAGEGEGEGEDDGEGEGGDDDGMASPGAVAARNAASRTLKLRADLVGVKERIAAISNRPEFSGASPL